MKKTPERGPSPLPKRAAGEFPMRINKYLAWKGYATRRGADELIERRQVTINGRFASLGDQVQAADAVEVRRGRKPESYVYYAYNKPRGLATEGTRKGGSSIMKTIPLSGVFPVGGLDTNAEGLIILTNDRRITDRLLNPAHAHLKGYFVRTHGPLRANFKEKMEGGVEIGGAIYHCSVKIISPTSFTVHLTDSGSHLRQMCAMFFAEIQSLTRTQILNIELGRMPPNSYRPIEGEELAAFLSSLGL